MNIEQRKMVRRSDEAASEDVAAGINLCGANELLCSL